jgi:hypothetical protein
MKKLILIPVLVTLLLSFDAFSQKIPHMTQIDKQELRYMDNSYISILAWQEYMYYTKEKYGQGSKEYLSIIPNIEEFNKHYNGKYSIVKIKDTYTFNPEKGFNKKRENFPIVGLSISQKEGYCKWRTEVFNYKVAKKHKVVFSLPTAKDYEKAIKLKKIKNIEENNEASFRCMATIVK